MTRAKLNTPLFLNLLNPGFSLRGNALCVLYHLVKILTADLLLASTVAINHWFASGKAPQPTLCLLFSVNWLPTLDLLCGWILDSWIFPRCHSLSNSAYLLQAHSGLKAVLPYNFGIVSNILGIASIGFIGTPTVSRCIRQSQRNKQLQWHRVQCVSSSQLKKKPNVL